MSDLEQRAKAWADRRHPYTIAVRGELESIYMEVAHEQAKVDAEICAKSHKANESAAVAMNDILASVGD